MFKTAAEVEAYMKEEGLTRNPRNGFLENEEGMTNPYVISFLKDGKWQAGPGVYLEEDTALDIFKLMIVKFPESTILLERCNDLQDYARVYVPRKGIITYKEYENNR